MHLPLNFCVLIARGIRIILLHYIFKHILLVDAVDIYLTHHHSPYDPMEKSQNKFKLNFKVQAYSYNMIIHTQGKSEDFPFVESITRRQFAYCTR